MVWEVECEVDEDGWVRRWPCRWRRRRALWCGAMESWVRWWIGDEVWGYG